MTPTRPSSVPADATLFYPDQTFPPGQGVQAASLKSVAATNAALNARHEAFFARAMADWNANKPQYEAYHQRVPPPPFRAPLIVDKVAYANQDGTIVEPPEGSDGLHYAWAWEVYE